MVIAKKKSGEPRVCEDLCAVNKAIIPDKYPLLTAEELTTCFYGSPVFNKLDRCHQGYLQVPLDSDSRDLTAFVTPPGVIHYTRMPFGLRSAPSCFQKMSSIVTSIPAMSLYLDDIVVHGSNTSAHDERSV